MSQRMRRLFPFMKRFAGLCVTIVGQMPSLNGLARRSDTNLDAPIWRRPNRSANLHRAETYMSIGGPHSGIPEVVGTDLSARPFPIPYLSTAVSDRSVQQILDAFNRESLTSEQVVRSWTVKRLIDLK